MIHQLITQAQGSQGKIHKYFLFERDWEYKDSNSNNLPVSDLMPTRFLFCPVLLHFRPSLHFLSPSQLINHHVSCPSQSLPSQLTPPTLLYSLFSLSGQWIPTGTHVIWLAFVLLGIPGPGDGTGPSVINETYCRAKRGQGERKRERWIQRERAEDNIYLACSKRDSKTTREQEKDLCGNDMDDECIRG